MKRLIVLVLAAGFAALATVASGQATAADYKIGFVNTERLFREAAPAKRAQQKLEREFATRDAEVQKLTKQVRDLQASLDKDGATMAENDLIARYRDRLPARFPAAVGIVEPAYGDACFAELERCKRELRLAGISFHTRFQGVSLDSRFILAYVAKMAELGLLPVIHAMNETPEEALWKLAVVARSVPDTPILALDAFGSYEATRECFFIAEVAPNLHFDTSLSYNFDFIEDFARQFGAERVVFGTDLYSHPVGRRISHLLPQILESKLSDDAKRAILAGNARRLFGVA